MMQVRLTKSLIGTDNPATIWDFSVIGAECS